MPDLTTYEVEVTYITKLGNMKTVFGFKERVEGREQLDVVISYLKGQGFELEGKQKRYAWSVYHADGSPRVIKSIANKLAEFPPTESYLETLD